MEIKSKKAGQEFLYRAMGGLAVVPLIIYMFVHLAWGHPLIYAIGLGVVYYLFYGLVIARFLLPNRIVVLPPEKPTEKMIKRKKDTKENAEAFQKYLGFKK